MKNITYNTKRFRQCRTYGPVQVWNDACREIDRRHKATLRRAGVYNPNGTNYPYPEDGTENTHKRINAYFERIRTQEHERLNSTLTERERLAVYGY